MLIRTVCIQKPIDRLASRQCAFLWIFTHLHSGTTSDLYQLQWHNHQHAFIKARCVDLNAGKLVVPYIHTPERADACMWPDECPLPPRRSHYPDRQTDDVVLSAVFNAEVLNSSPRAPPLCIFSMSLFVNTPDSDNQLVRSVLRAWTVFRLTCSLHGVHCSLHGVHCSLHGVHCSLHGVHCFPHGVHCSPHGVHCSPHRVHCSPHGVHCSPHGVHCSPHGVHCSPHGVHCSLHGVHCSPHGVHCSPHGVHCSLHGVHCSPHGVHCSLHRVHCSLHGVHCSLLPEQGNPLKFTLFLNIHSWICAAQRLHARTSVTSYTSVNIYNFNSRLAHFNALWMEYIRSLRTGIMEEYPVMSTSQGTYVPIEQTSEAIRVTYEICRAGGRGLELRTAGLMRLMWRALTFLLSSARLCSEIQFVPTMMRDSNWGTENLQTDKHRIKPTRDSMLKCNTSA